VTIGERLKDAGIVKTILGGFSDQDLIEGTTTDAKRAAVEAQIRAGRVEAARRCSAWTEIEPDLVPRGRAFVSASTDRVYTPYRGAVFMTASINIIAERNPLHFYVDEDGSLHFFELHPETWSEVVERRERRQRR
jgi:hypothetical protein